MLLLNITISQKMFNQDEREILSKYSDGTPLSSCTSHDEFFVNFIILAQSQYLQIFKTEQVEEGKQCYKIALTQEAINELKCPQEEKVTKIAELLSKEMPSLLGDFKGFLAVIKGERSIEENVARQIEQASGDVLSEEKN